MRSAVKDVDNLPAGLALAAAALTGLTPVILKDTSSRVDPAALNAVRFGVAALLLLPMSWSDLTEADIRLFALGAAVGVLGPGLAWYIYLKALRLSDVSVVSPLTNAYPLFSAPIYFALTGLKPSSQVALGTVVVSGVSLVAKSEGRSKGSLSLGAILSLVVAAIWGLNTVLLKLALSGGSPLALAFVRTATAAALLGPLYFARGGGAQPISRRDAASAAAVGVLGDMAAMLAMLVALDLGDPYVVIPLTSTTPIFAALFAGGLLRERVDPSRLVGILLTVAGGSLLTLS